MTDPEDQDKATRGAELKRLVRSAAAFHGIYDDKALAQAVGASRNAVMAWWSGAVPSPAHVRAIARVTGLDEKELGDYLYFSDDLPLLVEPKSAVSEAFLEELRRDRDSRRP